MKKKLSRKLALILCVVLVAVSCMGGAVVYALSTDGSQIVKTNNSNADLTKDETVYVLAGADGTVDKIIVSDWIKNTDKASEISDKSQVKDIEVVNGETSYTMDGDNMRVWDAQGNDVYYKGNIDKELPVDLSVSYKLDGKEIAADKLAGKSGKVTIRFDYTNKQYENVNIDGKQEKIYVPFAMMTGVLLDNKVFSNVEISNGKLVNDGDRMAVVGIAFPGLEENLKLDSKTLDIPDYVEITADVKDFKMDNAITLATSQLFNDVDVKNVGSLDELSDGLTKLTDAMNQLLDGSSELYDGLCTLLEKSNELTSGIDKLAAGATELNNGTKSLSGGLDKLVANNDSLNGGAKQVFDSLLSMADTQLKAAGVNAPKLTIDNYSKVLDGILSSLDPENVIATAKAKVHDKVAAEVNKQRDAVTAAVTEKVQEEVMTKVLASLTPSMTIEQYENAVKAGMISEQQKAQIEGAVQQQMATAEVQQIIKTKTDEQVNLIIDQKVAEAMKTSDVQAQITAAESQASEGAAAISSLKTQLDSYNAFYKGLAAYTAGVADADKGAHKINTGMSQLYDGILTLKKGAPALIDGVTQLKDGSMQLSDGLKEFNEEGIKKLTEAVDGDLGKLLPRIKATADVAKDYNNFSGISDGMKGQVKFVYRTDSIEKEDSKESK